MQCQQVAPLHRQPGEVGEEVSGGAAGQHVPGVQGLQGAVQEPEVQAIQTVRHLEAAAVEWQVQERLRERTGGGQRALRVVTSRAVYRGCRPKGWAGICRACRLAAVWRSKEEPQGRGVRGVEAVHGV